MVSDFLRRGGCWSAAYSNGDDNLDVFSEGRHVIIAHFLCYVWDDEIIESTVDYAAGDGHDLL